MAIFSAAIAAVSSFFSAVSATVVGAFALRTIASMGLSMLAQKLAGKKSQQADFSVKGQIGRGADVPQGFAFGDFATAGTLSYSNTADEGGKPNVLMYWVITLSDIPIQAVTGVWVNGAKCTLSASSVGGGWLKVDEFVRGSGEYLRIKTFDGTQTAAETELINTASSTERPWDATAVGYGRAYVVIRAYLHSELFQNGFPSFLFEVNGVKLYNPAKDGSVGGVGPHRWNTPATWEASDNPAVQLYNVLRGISYGGRWFYGLQDVTAAQLPAAHWIGQINKCSATVTGSSGPEPQFRASGEVPVSAAISGVIESLLAACNGRLSDAGGVYKLFAGAPDTPVMGVVDSDILSTQGQSFTPFFGLSDTVNGVSGKYPAPAAGWQVEAAPPIYRSDYEAEDGGRRLLVDVSLDFVPYPEQVQRLMKAALNEARRARRHTITLPPKFWPLEPGDIIAWTSVRNGYVSKRFRVDGMIDLPNADVVMDITEVDPADYDFDTGVDFTAPVIPGSATQPITVQIVGGFSVAPATIQDGAGVARRPAILASWDSDIPDVRAMKFETRVKVTGQMISPSHTDTVSAGQMYIAEGVLPATEYEVRAKFIPDGQRLTAWTAWLSVITPNVRIGAADIDDALAAVLVPDDVPPADPTGLAVSTSIVADGRGLLVATWTAPSDTDLDGYEVRIRIGTGNFVNVPVYSPRFEANIIPTQTYSVQVRAFDTSGNRSGYTALINGTAVADTTPPAVPTGLSITAGYQLLWLKWTPNTETDLHHYEILEQSAATPAPTTGTAATFSASGDQMARSGLPDAATRHYWIRAVDTSGNKSAWSARVQGTTATGAGVDPVALAGVLAASDGIVPSNALAANSVVTSKLAITDFENLIPDGVFAQKDLALVAATGGASVSFEDITWASAGTALRWQRPAVTGIASDIKQAAGYQTPVEAGKAYAFEISARARSAGKGIDMIPRVLFYGSDGVPTGIVSLPQVAFGTAFAAYANQITAPAGSAFAVWSLLTNNTAAEVDVQVQFVRLRRAGMGLLIVDGEIQANHLTTGELITASAQIKDAIITDAKIATLSAAKLTAGTALAGSITVSGTPLSTMKTVTDNPAAKVNSAATKIDPGKILISGATNLNDWQGLNDTTAINGGKIETNSITTKSLKVGDFSNMIPNGAFEAGLDGWTVTASQTRVTLAMVGKPAKYALLIPANGTFNQAVWGNSGNLTLNSGFPMNGGDQFYCGAWVYRSAANTTGNLTMNMQVGNGDDTVYLFPAFFAANTANATADTWVWMEGTVTIPDVVNAKLVTRGTLQVGTGSAATNGSFMVTGIELRRMTGGVMIEDGAIKASKMDTSDLSVAGLAIFGGSLESADFAAGLDGWQINDDGSAEFNNVIVRRQLEIDGGSIAFPTFTPSATGSGPDLAEGWALSGKVIYLDATNVAISEWMGAKRTYLLNAGMIGTVTATGGVPPDVYWGWEGKVLPLTKWSGNQTLRLQFTFWSRNVVSVSAGTLTWKLYEVS